MKRHVLPLTFVLGFLFCLSSLEAQNETEPTIAKEPSIEVPKAPIAPPPPPVHVSEADGIAPPPPPVHVSEADGIAPPPPPVHESPIDGIAPTAPKAPRAPFNSELSGQGDVDEMPRFPGCEEMVGTVSDKAKCANQKMAMYIGKNLKYPAEAREKGTQGKVIVSFVVNESGIVQDLAIAKDIGEGCGDACLEVFNKMITEGVQWIPGKRDGEAVKVELKIPVEFKL
jgi:protein TonB